MATHAIHAVTLPNGKVMIWDRKARTYLWDANEDTFERAPQAPFNTFCTGHVLMRDGTVFMAGGHIVNYFGLNRAGLYDWKTNSWREAPDMVDKRWYPTLTLMPDGDNVVVLSGQIDLTLGASKLPEVYNHQSRTFRSLTGAITDMPLYPHQFATSENEVYVAGPYRQTFFLNIQGTGTKRNSVRRIEYRTYDGTVFYPPNKIVSFSGGNPPARGVEVLNLTTTSTTTRAVEEIATPRRMHTSTILPDGRVLIIGGSSGPGNSNPAFPVFTTELWDPTTETFTTLAPINTTGNMKGYRGYHANAVLLDDGRVVSTSGDQIDDPNHYQAVSQVFEPPYLFKGERPVVTTSQSYADYGTTVTLNVESGMPISRVTAIAYGSSTHGFDMAERFLELGFVQNGDQIQVTMPANSTLAIPGWYRIFALNGQGVPSKAVTVQLDFIPPAISSLIKAEDSSAIEWTDSTYDETGFVVESSTDGRTWVEAASLPQDTSRWDLPVDAPTPGYYRVVVVRGDRRSAPSQPVRFAPEIGQPTLVGNDISCITTDWVTLKIVATESGTGAPIVGRQVHFKLDGVPLGTAVTDQSGEAICGYEVQPGPYARKWTAEMDDDSEYAEGSVECNLLVDEAPTVVMGTNRTAPIGGRILMLSTLTNSLQQPLEGRTVRFEVDGVEVARGVTDEFGTARGYYRLSDSDELIRHYRSVYDGEEGLKPTSSVSDIIVAPGTTTIKGVNVSSYAGKVVKMSATLSRKYSGRLLQGLTVNFAVAGNVVGSGVTNSSGVATFDWKVVGLVGTYPLEAIFGGDALNLPATATTTATIVKGPTKSWVGARTARLNQRVDFKPSLKDSFGVMLSGRTLEIRVAGVLVGSGVTDAMGVATISYVCTLAPGSYVVEASFAGDTEYTSSKATTTLTVNP